MVWSVLAGVIAGMRSTLPLAAVGYAARHRSPAGDPLWSRALASDPMMYGLRTLAAAELLGDKWRDAPDRVSPAGIAARLTIGGITAAALAPAHQSRAAAAVLGAAAACAAGYLSFAMRRRAMLRFGQAATGVVEDAVALTGALLIARKAGLR